MRFTYHYHDRGLGHWHLLVGISCTKHHCLPLERLSVVQWTPAVPLVAIEATLHARPIYCKLCLLGRPGRSTPGRQLRKLSLPDADTGTGVTGPADTVLDCGVYSSRWPTPRATFSKQWLLLGHLRMWYGASFRGGAYDTKTGRKNKQ